VVRRALAEVASQPIAKAVRRLVTVAIEAHRIDPKLHRVLAEQIPRTGALENVEAFNRETYALLRTYLEGHRGEIRVTDLGLATFVCVTSIEALAHNAVLRSESLSEELMRTLVDEATRLVVGYLQ
jgi:arginyl-tRNA--protein-N-Asp/Glu arginylyltransferase